MSTSDDILLTELRDNALHLTLNRPERRNALNDDLIERLAAAFADASADPKVPGDRAGGDGRQGVLLGR